MHFLVSSCGKDFVLWNLVLDISCFMSMNDANYPFIARDAAVHSLFKYLTRPLFFFLYFGIQDHFSLEVLLGFICHFIFIRKKYLDLAQC